MNNRGSGLAIIAGVLFVLLVSALVGGFCWTYSINKWLVFAHKPGNIAFWQGALIGFCPLIGQLSLPIAIITWIAFMFI